ncbi:MAG: general secretion pathway protein [Sphingomonadales bacterium]|nr:MAG: general secretion pathway protein [Sphingomonadales bacterium]
MYDDHYGLTGRPFQLTPDPKFWFDTATHRKAMAYLGYGLSQGEGFVVITGDPGVGKTTLMGHLLGEIDRERLNVIKIVSSQLRPEDLLRVVCGGLEINAGGMAKSDMLAAIERGLHGVARSGRRTLLVVDEAQALPIESLEELRMLSNFQAGGYPLLQIFLLGQPEFRLTLAQPSLEQLRQRVIAMHHLEPMEADEVEPYLIHRLSCVGWRGKPRFTNDAVAAMYRWSNGSPRLLNQLASRVLLFGAVEQIETFGEHELTTVIADLHGDTPNGNYKPAPAEPEPLELSQIAPMAMGTPTPSPAPDPMPIRAAAPAPVAAPAAAPFASDDAVTQRIAQLEAQIKEQDEALRRVLTLLVDWVETNDASRRPDLSALRGNAA